MESVSSLFARAISAARSAAFGDGAEGGIRRQQRSL
jgi:hypothetical protein